VTAGTRVDESGEALAQRLTELGFSTEQATVPDEPEDIAMALYDKFPQQDPLKVRFTDLHKWITELEDFGDDPSKSNEGKLEAIQMAWHEEWQENQE
jgi:FeS assembly protein IscX